MVAGSDNFIVSHCSLYLPSHPAWQSCQFHQQTLFTVNQKLHHLSIAHRLALSDSSYSIPTHHLIKILFLSKFLLTSIVFFLYIKQYDRLCFNKMTIKQVAEYLQIDEHTVYKLARSGLIPSLKIASQWRFKKDIIDKWISEKSLKRVTENIKSFLKKKGKKR